MTIQSDRNRIAALQKEIAQIHSQITKERDKAQRKNAEISSIHRSLNKKTSISALQSKQRQIDQKNKEILSYDKKVSSLLNRQASKNTQLQRYNSSLEKKQKTELDKRIREDKKRQSDADRLSKKRSDELARQVSLHKQLSENPIIVTYQNLPEKIIVLFIASNPKDQAQLGLDEEVRLIEQKIRASDYRDSVEIKSVWAARPGDLLQALNEHKPTIVHFSGHGSEQDELVLQDDEGRSKLITKPAIVQLFNATSSGIELIFFNTCFSAGQASEITRHVPATIGMTDTIGDDAARVFAAQLYSAIGFGKSIEVAFAQAIAALMLDGIPEDKTPKLYLADNTDGNELILVRP